MTLRLRGHVPLPAHRGDGGFDHAALHARSSRLYVAHTANDAVEILDATKEAHIGTVPGLKGVAGVLVSEEAGLVFTSNRGEDTVGLFEVGREDRVEKVPTGRRPNGLSYDPGRKLLLAANVGDPQSPGTAGLTFIDADARTRTAEVAAPGRTRWALYDPDGDRFYVNVADPPVILEVDPDQPGRIARKLAVPARGPHGLDLDAARRRLYCACDDAVLVVAAIPSGEILGKVALSGPPDVIFYHPALDRIYVAVGDPGVIDVVDTADLERVEVVRTEKGAHTIALDPGRNRVYAFLPGTHRAAVFEDTG